MIIFQSSIYFPTLKLDEIKKNISVQEKTYVPDDNFEAALISYGYDDVLDDYVITSNISSLKSLKLNDRQILDAGLSAKNESGEYYERFINRITIPINDKNGRAISFGGRDFTNKAPAKSLNSPETILFQKKDYLIDNN